MNIAFNEDCINVMRRYPDKYFDLAVVDPPYGIQESGRNNKTRSGLTTAKNYKPFYGNDKEPPSCEYFAELKRVSKNQIIFGANHFISRIDNADSSCWIVWDKCRPIGVDFADFEMAWTSFDCAAKLFRYMWNGMCQGKNIDEGHIQQGNKRKNEFRIHPTQKPLNLYRWIYREFKIPPRSKIIDTHLGSGTNRMAAYDFELEFVGCEIDDYYFELQEKAFEEYTAQMKFI